MSDRNDKKTKADSVIPTSVPESAFEEALKAIENLQKAGAQKAKPKKTEPREKISDLSADDDESLQGLLKILEMEEPKKNAPRAGAMEEDPDSTQSDLDMLAKLLEEEQNLEKEAEFLKSVLLEAQTQSAGPGSDPEAIKKKESQIQELQDRLIRIQADFDNFKKRINRDKADMVRFSNENLILSILPIIDNFERAISHAGTVNDPQATIDGVRLILKQLYDTLQSNGVRKIDATSQMFDPNYHEAMATIATDNIEPGRVIVQYEPGYLLHSRLLRPAKVVVSRKLDGEEGNSEMESGQASAVGLS